MRRRIRWLCAVLVCLGPAAAVDDLTPAFAKEAVVHAVIEGRVRDGKQGLGGVPLQLRSLLAEDLTTAFRMGSAGALVNRALVRAVKPWDREKPVAKSDANGRFRVTTSGPGLYALRAMWKKTSRILVIGVTPIASTILANVDMAPGPGRVTGSVVTGKRAGFSGNVVALWQSERQFPFVVWTTTEPQRRDGAGPFSFSGLPKGRYAVGLIDDQAGIVHSEPVEPGKPLRVRLPQRLRVTVHGRITDEAAEPVANASVTVDGGPELARSDAAGNFEFVYEKGQRLPKLTVQALGFARTDEQVQSEAYAPSRVPADVTLVKESVLRGVVRSANKPLSSVDVMVIRVPELPSGSPILRTIQARQFVRNLKLFRSITDAQGRYTLGGLPAGKYLVGAQNADWVSTNMPIDVIDVSSLHDIAAGESKTIDLACQRTGSVLGRVLSPRGKGVRGVQVVAKIVDKDMQVVQSAAASGVGGRFTLRGLAPGESYRIEALSPARSGAHVSGVEVEAGKARPVEVQVGDAAWLDVLVRVWPDKKPRAGVIVTLGNPRAPGLAAGLGGSRAIALTDEKGRAKLGPLPVGASTINALGPGLVITRATFEPFDMKGGTRSLTLDIGKGASLGGRVALPAGASMDDVDLSIRSPDGERRLFEFPVKEPDGRFRYLKLDPGSYRVRAALSHEGQVLSGMATGAIDESGLQIRLRPYRPDERSGVWLVRVRGPNGAYVPDARVARYTREPDAAKGARPGTQYVGSETVRNGVVLFGDPFENRPLDRPAPGTRTWFVAHTPRDANEQPLAAGAALVGPLDQQGGVVDIRLSKGRTVIGRLQDDAGQPIVDVSVHAVAAPAGMEPRSYDDGPHTEATTDADGRFRFDALGALPYALFAGAPKKFVAAKPTRVTADQNDVIIVRRRGIAAMVTLVDEEGAPVVGESIEVTRDVPGLVEPQIDDFKNPMVYFEAKRKFDAAHPPAISERTDERGRAHFAGLDPGATYRLHVNVVGDSMREAERRRWKPADTTLKLPPRESLRVRIVTAAGVPVPGARLFYRAARMRWREDHRLSTLRLSLDDNEFAVDLSSNIRDRDDPKAYDFYFWATLDPHANPPASTSDPEWKRVVRARPRKEPLKITVDPGPTVSIAISGWKSNWSPATVLLFEPDDEDDRGQETSTTNGNAAFFGRNPSAKYLVYVISQDGRVAGSAAATVSERPTSVTLRPAKSITGKIIIPKGVLASAVNVGAWSADGVGLAGESDLSGNFFVNGLLPGEWTIVVSASWRGKEYYADATVSAGSTATIRLAESK